jgi:hypothetical protein
MPKPLSKRISDSFTTDGDEAEAEKYLNSLWSAWRDLSNSLAKLTILLFLIIAVFELLVYQRSPQQIVFASFSLADTPVIQIFLPGVVSYVFYDVVRTTTRWLDIEYTYYKVGHIVHPWLTDNQLDLLTVPMLPGVWRPGTSVSRDNEQAPDKFFYQINRVVSVFFGLILPFIFASQAYYLLYIKYHAQEPLLLWISAAITSFFLVVSFIYMVLYSKSEE